MIITIRGFLTGIDKYNTAKLVFLDDYNGSHTTIRDTDSFTKTFMEKKYRSDGSGCSPMVDNTTFKIKCGKIHVGYAVVGNIIKILNIRELIQHQVECVVKVKNYNFKKNEVIYKGWTILLQEMRLLKM